jgi:hypothetical protein
LIRFKTGIDTPLFVPGGICSSCLARALSLELQMTKNSILTDKIADGLILTCQHPASETIYVDYDDVWLFSTYNSGVQLKKVCNMQTLLN